MRKLFQLDLSIEEIDIKREELNKDKSEDKNPICNTIDDDGVDVEKDTAAIEDISNQLDTAIQVQSDLTNQLEVNKTVENPTIENIADSEVAIESAIAKLGVSREEYGLHNKSYNSFSVSQEGIKQLLNNVIKFIKELIKKVIRFFKDLWNKLRLKFSNYKPKLDLVKSSLKNIDEDKLNDSKILQKVAEELSNLRLASVELYLGRLSSAPFPKPYNNEFLKQLKVVIEDGAMLFKEFCKKTMLYDTRDETNKSIIDLMLDYTNKRKLDELDREFVSLVSINSSNLGSMCFGCSDDKLIGFYIHRQNWADDNKPDSPGWRTEMKIVEEKISQSSFTDIKNTDKTKWNYKAILDSYSYRLPELYKLINNNEISERALALQQALDKSVSELQKGQFADKVKDIEHEAVLKLATNHFTNSAKQIAVNLPVLITKTYVSVIRDYLIIANVLIKNFSK